MAFRFGFAPPPPPPGDEGGEEGHVGGAEGHKPHEEEATVTESQEAGPLRPLEFLDASKLLQHSHDTELVTAKQQLDTIVLQGQPLFRALSERIVEIQIQEEESDADIGELVRNQVDVKSGVYEGGFKVWECTFDLLHFLLSTGVPFEKQRVLELGCGAGYPGLFALSRGAEQVDFQDFNACVLEKWTAPNVAANDRAAQLTSAPTAATAIGPATTATSSSSSSSSSSPSACGPTNSSSQSLPSSSSSSSTPPAVDGRKCRFIAGDWAHPQADFPRAYYDVILMAETVYAQSSLDPLARLITRCIRPGGTVLLAAKSCYYGVGGSVAAFTQALLKQPEYEWKAEEVWQTSSGLRRVIVRYTAVEKTA